MSMSNTDVLADTSASAFAVVKKELGHVDYLDPSDPQMIPTRDNVMLVDWCYCIVDRYRYSREAVGLAMEIVVRFLSLSSPCNSAAADARCYYTRPRVFNEALSLRDPSKLQLLIVTALYISIKINEKVSISSDLYSEMCHHIYSAEEIEEAERMLLSGLLFKYHAPTAHQAGASILSLQLPCVEVTPEVTGGLPMGEMKYPTELALSDYCFSSSRDRASTIDLAAESLAKHSGTLAPVEREDSSISMDDSLKTSKASNRSSDSDTDELTACSEITCIPERGHGQDDHASCTSSSVLARIIKNLLSKPKHKEDIGNSAIVDPNQNAAFVVDTSTGTADSVKIKISKQSSEKGPSPLPTDDRRHPASRKGSRSGSAHNEEIQPKSHSNPRRRSTIDVPPRSRRSGAPTPTHEIQPRSHMKRRSTIDDGHRVHPKKGSSFNVEDSSRGPMKKSTSTPSFHNDFHSSSLPRRDRCRSSTSKFDYRPVLVHSREDESPSGKEYRRHQTIDHHRRKRTSSRPRRKGKEDEKSRSRSRHSKSQVPVPGPPPSRPPELGRSRWKV